MDNFFEEIVAPYSVEDFLNGVYEKEILYIKRNNAGYYQSILTPDEISAYLERQDLYYPSVRVVSDGKEVASSQYTLKNVPIGHHRKEGIISVDKLFTLFNSGATMVIQAGQRYFNNLSRCCLQLSRKFNSPVQANLYITPNKSQGFHPHWDTHDVFVLQISGTKTWHLYGFEKELPTKNQTFVSKDYNKQPTQTIILNPGDFLYVPRGYVHDAVANDGISSHITIGILSFTWMRFFNELLPQLEEHKDFREAVPFWKGDITDVMKEKISLLQNKIAGLNFNDALHKLNHNYRNAQPQPFQHYFNSLLDIEKITHQTVFAVNNTIIYEWEKKGDVTYLKMFDKMIQVSDGSKPLIEHIFKIGKFTLNDLSGESMQKMELVKRLVKEGIVYINTI